MAEMVQSGQYVVGTVEDTPRRDPKKTIGVANGETINESRRSGFSRIIGVSTSKWYVYEEEEHLRNYNDRSGTGVLMVVSLVKECDSKSEAVEYAESKYSV